MIKTLKLANFQSHKTSLLEFHSGVNVIVGSTDSGKTSIIRALRKLAWNRPSGDAFRSNWGGHTHIHVKTGTDSIEWFTTSTGQGYRLNTQTHFKAFGKGIPEEIAMALNITEINLQQQHDPIFLLTSTPGEVAQHFNRIAKLDQIDFGLRNVNSMIREIETDIKFENKQVEDGEEELKKYAHLEKFEVEVEALEELQKKLSSASKDKATLASKISTLKSINADITCEEMFLELEDPVNNILDLIYKRDALVDGPIATINQLVKNVQIIDEQLEELNELVAEEDFVDMILQWVRQREQLNTERRVIQDKIHMIVAIDIELARKKKELTANEVQFEKEFPNSCPLCGKPK